MTARAPSAETAPTCPTSRQRSLRIAVGLEGLAMGGCPINALDLARTLRDRGHRLDVFAIDEDVKVSLLPYAERSGFSVTPLPRGASTWHRARQIREFADRHQSDVVHVYAPFLGPPAAVATTTRPGRAAVVTNWTMDNSVRTPSRTPLIVGTKELQVEARQRQISPVWLLEPPVDLTSDRPSPEMARRFRAHWRIADDDVALVVVSRLDHVMKAEGIGYAIRTVEALGLPEVRLVVVGDGNAHAQLRAHADEVNARLGREAVVLTGAMLDPRPAYASADIVLGMGGSAIRALAHGRPLVVLGEDGFARTFHPDTLDYFYEAGFYGRGCVGDPVAHLQAQVLALMDRRARESLGRFGLDQARGRFSLSAAATTLENIYRDALDHPAPRLTSWADSAGLLARSHVSRALYPVRRRLGRARR